MFWKIKPLTNSYQVKEKEQVKCETCKHYVDIGDGQIVSGHWYCPLHRLPYDKIDWKYKAGSEGKVITTIAFFKKIPEHFVEVNAKGQEIKK